MLQCTNLLCKFGKATLAAVTCLAHNWFKVLLLLLLYTTLPVVSIGLVLMVLKCKDYACYLCFKNLPVLITTTPVYFITILLLILYSRRVRNTRAGKWYLDKTSAVTQLAFGSFLKNHNPNNEEEEEEKKVFTVFGHEASLKEMRWLFIILVQATLLAIAQFCDEFLLEESYSCSTHPRVHCFSTTFLPPSGQHVNCSDIDTSDTGRHVIVCYKYVFNIGRAAASAIGIISATGFIIYIVCLMFLKLLNGIRSHKRLIIGMKLLAAAEIFMFWPVLDLLLIIDMDIFPMTNINHSRSVAVLTLDYFALIRSSYKTLTMTLMIVSSILSFPWNKFSEYDEL